MNSWPPHAEDPENCLFVYGTLAPGQSNHRVLAGLSGRWISGWVRGQRFEDGGGAAAGYPGLILDPAGGRVSGLLFLSRDLPRHWVRLDRFEGPGYRRVQTPVHLPDGTVCIAQAYALRQASEGP